MSRKVHVRLKKKSRAESFANLSAIKMVLSVFLLISFSTSARNFFQKDIDFLQITVKSEKSVISHKVHVYFKKIPTLNDLQIFQMHNYGTERVSAN